MTKAIVILLLMKGATLHLLKVFYDAFDTEVFPSIQLERKD